MTAPDVAALALAALIGSAAQSATGFGVALTVAPVTFAVLKPTDAVLTVAAISLTQNLLVLLTRHRRLHVRLADAGLLIAAAIPGLLLGALIVAHVSKPPMQLAVGITILAAVVLRAHQPGRFAALQRRSTGAPVGLVAGLLTTTVGVNGPPLVIWLRARGTTLTQLRDTLAVIFMALNLAAIPSLTTRGGSIPAVAILPTTAGLLAGHILGLTAHNRVSTNKLDHALEAVLTAAAAASIIGAVTAIT
jgi:uncharacterized membrane protein YfcA